MDKSVIFQNKKSVIVVGNLQTNISSKTFLNKFTNIFSAVSKTTKIISADVPIEHDNIIWHRLESDKKSPFKFINYWFEQLNICTILYKEINKEKLIILTTPSFLLVTFGRIIGYDTYTFFAQIPSDKLARLMCYCTALVTNKIIVESPRIAASWGFKKDDKRINKGAIYVDQIRFRQNKKNSEKTFQIGYIGNLEERKGVINFVEACKILSENGFNFSFLLGGKGSLEKYIVEMSKNIKGMQYLGSIPDDDLPTVLNDLKLLVLPTQSEGLPNIILESMACGTPVLATPVGGIADVIEDGHNGFIIENSKPKVIADGIIRAINNDRLEEISNMCRKTVESDFSLDEAILRYHKMLS